MYAMDWKTHYVTTRITPVSRSEAFRDWMEELSRQEANMKRQLEALFFEEELDAGGGSG